MLSFKIYEMPAVWPNYILIFTFYAKFSNSIQNLAVFVKEVFWFDVQFRMWQNNCLTFNFHQLIFVREVFGFDALLTKWRNDCFVRKWKPNVNFLSHTCILPCIHTFIHSRFFTASKSVPKLLKFSFNGTMSKQGATGEYLSILE